MNAFGLPVLYLHRAVGLPVLLLVWRVVSNRSNSSR